MIDLIVLDHQLSGDIGRTRQLKAADHEETVSVVPAPRPEPSRIPVSNPCTVPFVTTTDRLLDASMPVEPTGDTNLVETLGPSRSSVTLSVWIQMLEPSLLTTSRVRQYRPAAEMKIGVVALAKNVQGAAILDWDITPMRIAKALATLYDLSKGISW